MRKAIHGQESKESAREKASQVTEKFKEMKLFAAAKKLTEGIEETLTCMDFPSQHTGRGSGSTTPSNGSTGRSSGGQKQLVPVRMGRAP